MSATRPDQHDARPNVPQLLLPGQVAAPPGPLDVRMMYVMHFAFRRDLDLLVAATAATPVTDHATWQALAARWAFFSDRLEHHHRGEDTGLWPLLLSYAAPDERQLLEAMEAEHAMIDPLLDDCRAQFATVVAGSFDVEAGRRLSERLLQAATTLGAHLGHEETEAMAMVQRRLTQQQWDQMAKESFERDQAVRDLLANLPWVMHQMPAAQAADMLRWAGRPFVILWLLTRRGFERREARLRRHLPASPATRWYE